MATKTVTTLEMKLTADDQASTKMGRLAAQLQNVSAKYDMQAAAAAKLKAQMDGLDTTTSKGAAQAAKLQAQYDRLQLSMRNTEVQGGRLKEAIAAGGTAFDLQGAKMTALLTKIAAGGKGAEEARKEFAALTGEMGKLGAAATAQAGKIGALGGKIDNLGNAVNTQGGKISGMVGKLGTLAAGYATLQGAQQAITWAKEGAAIQGVTESFDKLAQSVGKTGPTLLSEMQAASKGTISNAELMAKANAAVLLGGQDLASKLPQMLQIAGASAKAMGTDVNTAFDSLVTGLARGSVEIIDNLGITVDAAGAYQRYADSIGVSVNELTKAQKTQAFQNEVMTQGMATVDKLGTATLTSAEKIAQAETKLKNFTDGLKVLAGESLGNVLTFINQDQLMTTAIADGTAKIIARNGTYADYAARMQSVGLAAQTLTEAEYAQVAALIANGAAADVALSSTQGLTDASQTLLGQLDKTSEGAYASAEAKAALIAQVQALGSTTPETSAAVAELLAQLQEIGDIEAFAAAIDNLSINQEFAASTAFGYADAQIYANDAIAAGIDPTTAAGQALLDKANADIEAGQAALDTAAFEQDLAFALQMSEGSAVNAAAASAWLASTYGIEVGSVRTLIDATNKLNAARAGQMGVDLGRDIGASIPTVAAKAPGYAPGGAYNRPKSGGGRAGGSGGGGSGGSGGKASNAKSPAAKAAEKEEKDLKAVQDKIDKAARDHQRKMEDAKQDHADKLQAIDEEYFRKNLEATNAFNEDKFASQLSFQQGLIDLDQDLYDQALAAEDQYWAESQAMAQAGNATQAAEYYAAGVALTDIIAQNAQEMRDLRAQIAAEEDEAERAKLEQRLARLAETNAQEEQLARDKVEAVKNGGDQIEQERQEAIDKENADYSDAQDSLKQAFGETMDDIKEGFSDAGDAMQALGNKMIEVARATAEAIAAIPSPSSGGEASGGEGGGESGGESQGSYAIGTGDRGLPRTGLYTGHAGEIIPSIGQSNQIRAMGGLSDVLSRSAATAGMGGNSSTSNTANMQVTMAPGAVVVGGSNATPAQIRDAAAAGAKVAMQEFNTSIGRSALNKRRSG